MRSRWRKTADLKVHIVPRGGLERSVTTNPSIQNRNVHSGLALLDLLHKFLHRFEVLHVDFDNLDLHGLKFVSNFLSSDFSFFYVPHPEDEPRAEFCVRLGRLEAHAGVCTGDENRLT